MRGMFLFVRRSLLLLGVEKDRLDWGEYIALNVADVGRLVFVCTETAARPLHRIWMHACHFSLIPCPQARLPRCLLGTLIGV